MSPATASLLAYQHFDEWSAAQQITNQYQDNKLSTRQIISWTKPEAGWIKRNVDATIFNDNQSFGVGMIIHNDQETFIAAKTQAQSGIPEPKLAEAWGLLQAVNWASEMNLDNVRCA